MGFLGGSDGKESAGKVGDLGLIPGLGRSPRGEHGNPLQYSCLGNPMDRRANGLQSWDCKESNMTASSTFTFHFHFLLTDVVRASS